MSKANEVNGIMFKQEKKRIMKKEYHSRCDKCGEVVYPWNDALELDIYAGFLHPAVKMTYPTLGRHLFPTEDCVGSPSRCQYLEGYPRDTRRNYEGELAYPYRPDLKNQEERYRMAYRMILETTKEERSGK